MKFNVINIKCNLKIFYLKIRLFTSKAEEEDESQKGTNKATKGGIVYGEYLQVINLKSSTFIDICTDPNMNYSYLTFQSILQQEKLMCIKV